MLVVHVFPTHSETKLIYNRVVEYSKTCHGMKSWSYPKMEIYYADKTIKFIGPDNIACKLKGVEIDKLIIENGTKVCEEQLEAIRPNIKWLVRGKSES